MTEVASGVTGVRGSGKVRCMTAVAISRQTCVDVVYMTGIADHCLMCTGQGKGRGRMIKRCRSPCRRRVTWAAVMTEVAGDVVWICGSSKI